MKKYIIICLLMAALTGCGSSISRSGEVVTTTAQTETATTTAQAVTTTTPMTTTEKKTTTTKKKANEKIEYSYSDTLEVYQKITVGEWIRDATIKPDNAKDTVATDTLGENEITVKFGDKKEKIKYTVKDTTAPIFIYCPGVINVHKGSGFEPSVYMGYGDNYDKAPTVSYAGNIDTKTAGLYDITLTIADASGNTASKDVTISVVDVLPEAQSNIPRTNFADFKEKYSSDTADVGIDVSYWQGDVDFNKVKAAGCSFVFVRAAHHSDSIYPDENFYKNVDNALAAGLDVGVYFFSTCSGVEEAREHAQWVIDKLGGRELSLPIAFDWESFDRFQRFGMSIHDLNECYRAFSEVIEENGYKAILYSSRNFLESFWEEDVKDEVWLANYTEQTEYGGSYTYWQQGLGLIDGINGDVDVDVRYFK